jgi:hypothetical protein
MLKRFSLIFIGLLLVNNVFSQEEKDGASFFLEPEIMFGKIVANYSDYPESNVRKTYALSIGRQQHTLKNSWAKYFNFPATGVSVSFSDLGNPRVFGYEYAIIPFIILNNAKQHQKAWYFKMGLGTSYFTKSYARIAENEAVGSKFTWSFQTTFYKNIHTTESLNVRLGVGFLHGSNAHAQLPNFGINSAMLSVSAQWFNKKFDPDFVTKNPQTIDRSRHYFVETRGGLGYHEYGGTHVPIGGETRPVKTFSLGAGVVYRNHIKVRTGVAYRYYEHYYNEIITDNNEAYIDQPKWNSSNVFWYLGTELLLGHIGLNFEGGINLYKPYYKVYYDEYIFSEGLKEFLKKTFNSRLGINLYAQNTNKNPKHNVYIGANISTNFGQADFGEMSVGYVMRLR